MIYAGVGGYIGYNYNSWSEELLKAVNEKRVERGLEPRVRKDILTFSPVLNNSKE